MALLYLLVLVHLVAAVQVSTKSGKLKGDFIKNKFGNNYYAFSGIPYAKPLADISSKDPEPIGKWNGVRDATIGWRNKTNMTNDTQVSEDCLYLTIYTRKIKRWLPPTMVQTYRLSPVEVYFEGCNIGQERNKTKPTTDNFLDKDVVEVLVYHRDRSSSPPGDRADVATKDQLLALEWIKDNILSFGGDPQTVAVYQGHSGLADIDINRLSDRGK